MMAKKNRLEEIAIKYDGVSFGYELTFVRRSVQVFDTAHDALDAALDSLNGDGDKVCDLPLVIERPLTEDI